MSPLHGKRFRGRSMIALVTFLAIKCSSGGPPEPSRALRARDDCPTASSEDFYFPDEAIDPANDLLDNTLRETYSHLLRAAGAPSLSCGAVGEAYRFLWIPAFRPARVILLRRTQNDWIVTATGFNDPRIDRTFGVVGDDIRRPNDGQPGELIGALASAGFWTLPAYGNSFIEDGATWVIEGRLRTGYRVVTRLNPSDEKFKSACRQFFLVAGLAVPREASN